MSEIEELSTDEQNHLAPYLPPTDFGKATLPFVTLTYAQSMDGMISLAPGVRTQLSGQESKDMTHYLRSKHDAILVGAGTAVADKPSLTCRYPTSAWTPVPVIVDPNGRYDLTSSKMIKLAHSGQGKVPLIITKKLPNMADHKEESFDYKKIFVNPEDPSTSTLSWESIFKALKKEGINSVMVEGGAKVISQLLSQPDLVNSVIITTAPKWLGRGGLAPTPEPRTTGLDAAASLRDVSSRAYGDDVVLCGRLRE